MPTTNMADPCDICGDIGVFEAIMTCCDCKISRQHLYCMRVVTTEAPQFWLCEECERKKLFSPKSSAKEQIHEPSKQKVPNLIPKNTRVLKCPNKNAFASRFNFKEKRVNTGRTKYISCEEAVKLSSGANKSPSKNAFGSKYSSSKSMAPPREKSLSKIYGDNKFETHSQQPVVQKSSGVKEKNDFLSPLKRVDDTESIKSKKSSRRVERTNTEFLSPKSSQKLEKTNTQASKKIEKSEVPITKEEADMEVTKSTKKDKKTNTKESIMRGKIEVSPPTIEESDIKVSKSPKKVEESEMKTGGENDADVEAGSCGEPNLTTGATHHTSIPAFHSYWKGTFYLPKEYENLNAAFKAHPPSCVLKKVYDTIKKMPDNIKFELIPIHEIWDIFQGYCPDRDDIGVYFFPRFKNRFDECTSLMDFLWSKNMVMKSHVDEVELLVFHSRLLLNSQEFEGNYFLWGVFRPKSKGAPEKSKSIVVYESFGQRGGVDTTPIKIEDCPPGFEKLRK